MYSELGRPEEALSAAEEAVAVRRELADALPGQYLPACAAALDALIVLYIGLSRHGEALPFIEEAVSAYRGSCSGSNLTATAQV